MTHLLVTNDYPPKIGGIQNYLWELWRRLPSDEFAVLTTPYTDDARFDAGEPYRIVRTRQRWLLPTIPLRKRIDDLTEEIGASLVVFDPAVPVGVVGPRVAAPHAVVLHGAEVSVPARVPGLRWALDRAVGGSALVVVASRFAGDAAEAVSGPFNDEVYIPPGVDVRRFTPLSTTDRAAARRRFGLPVDQPLVLGISRLVPRKGMDTLIAAIRELAPHRPELHVAVAGKGRDERRLRRLAEPLGARAHLLGRVPDADLPALYGCADVFAMLCRVRWGGLEQEGFGIVFLEAAAAGVPQVAGRSGGADEAVVDGETGFVVDPPDDPSAVAALIEKLIAAPGLRRRMGAAARARAERDFSYDILAERLHRALARHGGLS